MAAWVLRVFPCRHKFLCVSVFATDGQPIASKSSTLVAAGRRAEAKKKDDAAPRCGGGKKCADAGKRGKAEDELVQIRKEERKKSKYPKKEEGSGNSVWKRRKRFEKRARGKREKDQNIRRKKRRVATRCGNGERDLKNTREGRKRKLCRRDSLEERKKRGPRQKRCGAKKGGNPHYQRLLVRDGKDEKREEKRRIAVFHFLFLFQKLTTRVSFVSAGQDTEEQTTHDLHVSGDATTSVTNQLEA